MYFSLRTWLAAAGMRGAAQQVAAGRDAEQPQPR